MRYEEKVIFNRNEWHTYQNFTGNFEESHLHVPFPHIILPPICFLVL